MVIERGAFVEREVNGHRLIVDESADVIFDLVRLDGPNAVEYMPEHFAQQEEHRNHRGDPQKRLKNLTAPAPLNDGTHAVHERPNQQDERRWNQALKHEEYEPQHRASSRRRPHEPEGAREVGEVRKATAQSSDKGSGSVLIQGVEKVLSQAKTNGLRRTTTLSHIYSTVYSPAPARPALKGSDPGSAPRARARSR